MLTTLMHKLRAIREEKAEGDRGFTLIELLVVVVIIGILVAIAIPLYGNYKKGAENKSAQSDVRNAVPVVEQYYTDNGNAYPTTGVAATYLAGTTTSLTLVTGGTATANISQGNTLVYTPGSSTNPNTYAICGYNGDGAKWFMYSSKTGQTTTPTGVSGTPTVASCLTASAL